MLAIIQNVSTAETNENTLTAELKQRNDVESQTSSKKETSLQNPEPSQEHSGTQTWKTRERMRTTPRVILILKQASSADRLHKTLAQKWHVTGIKALTAFNRKNGGVNGVFCRYKGVSDVEPEK